MSDVLSDCGDNRFTDSSRNRIINPSLNHAWAARVCDRENVAKIKIVRKHDEIAVFGESHYLGIERLRIADFRPMYALNVSSREVTHPRRSEIHVYEDLHLDESGTSNSSARLAA